MKKTIISSESKKVIGIFLNKHYHQITCTLDDTDEKNVKILELTDVVSERISQDVFSHAIGTLTYAAGGMIQVSYMPVDAVAATSRDLKAIVAQIETGVELVETEGVGDPRGLQGNIAETESLQDDHPKNSEGDVESVI
uniref:Uncharacterized protein n=1 Tax=Prevotella sp. GTC17260 TaxID=3236796 RepID=A0AB33JFT9_9BACT